MTTVGGTTTSEQGGAEPMHTRWKSGNSRIPERRQLTRLQVYLVASALWPRCGHQAPTTTLSDTKIRGPGPPFYPRLRTRRRPTSDPSLLVGGRTSACRVTR